MRTIIAALGISVMLAGSAFAAELVSDNRTFGWQDREYFGVDHSKYQLGSGEAAAAGESGDAGAAAGTTGGSTGDSGNGDACCR